MPNPRVSTVPIRRVPLQCPNCSAEPQSVPAVCQSCIAQPQNIVPDCLAPKRPCRTQAQSLSACKYTSSAQPQNILLCPIQAIPEVPWSAVKSPHLAPDLHHPNGNAWNVELLPHVGRLAQRLRMTLQVHAPYCCWKYLITPRNHKNVRVGMFELGIHLAGCLVCWSTDSSLESFPLKPLAVTLDRVSFLQTRGRR